jgi:hypothetical protein
MLPQSLHVGPEKVCCSCLGQHWKEQFFVSVTDNQDSLRPGGTDGQPLRRLQWEDDLSVHQELLGGSVHTGERTPRAQPSSTQRSNRIWKLGRSVWDFKQGGISRKVLESNQLNL